MKCVLKHALFIVSEILILILNINAFYKQYFNFMLYYMYIT